MHFKIPLWDHQLEALAKSEGKKEYALFMEPGTGKTATAITMFRRWCNELREIPTTLIISPLITLENWKREIEAHCGDRVAMATKVLTGPIAARCKVFRENTGKQVFITNHEILDSKEFNLTTVMRKPRILIVDECHRFKKPTAARTKKIHEIADRAEFKLILSGSPVLNSTLDLWGQLRILGTK